ncbi:MAG: type II secretion system protein GspD [Henriciella sp.]
MQLKSERAKTARTQQKRWAAALGLALLSAGCASTPKAEPDIPDVRNLSLVDVVERQERTISEDAQSNSDEIAGEANSSVRRAISIPRLSEPEEQLPPEVEALKFSPKPMVDTINLSMDPLPSAKFVDLVFGQLLGVPYTVGDGVAEKTGALRLIDPVGMDSERFLQWAINYLKQYQIRVIPTPDGYEIVTDESLMNRIPLLLTNRLRESVDAELRPVVQFVELQAISANEMQAMLQKMLPPSTSLLVEPNPRLNIVTLTGLIDDVDGALQIIDQLDELPYAGTQAERYSPAYWSAAPLAEELLKLLAAEGWQASNIPSFQKPILVLPIEYSNDLVIFARSPAALARARFWLSELDRATRKGDATQTFVYTVQNVDAEILAETINSVLSRGSSAPRAQSTSATTGGNQPQFQQDQPASAGSIVVNRQSNQLIFSGTPSQYGEIRPLLVQLDQAPAEVLIEVTVAEITLTDSNTYGVQFFIDSLGNQDVGGTFRNQGLGLGGAGSNLALFSGNVEAAINFFAQNNLVNVLSTPRLMARSGGSAQIQVGTDVPIITSQTAADSQNGSGNTDILQSVDYRSTGILLSIEPIVFGDDRIDLAISQEVSTAISTTTSAISSPTISNRSVTTQLSLEDGETAVLGGLITTNSTVDEKGTPILKDIPLLGPAFRNTTLTQDKTELLVLITAYVLRGTQDKRQFTDALIDQFNRSQSTSSELSTMLPPKGRKVGIPQGRHMDVGSPRKSFEPNTDDYE